jgi:tRNA/tmRNA/rRNA uracil-C5-methylase (TrmA/RlmC/RlmD family)
LFFRGLALLSMRWLSHLIVPPTSCTTRHTLPLASASLDCPHYDACPGCSLTTALHEPPLMREARAWFTDRGVSLTSVAGSPHGWRTTAKLAVRANSRRGGPPLIGLFARGSHDVVDVPRCAVHHPSINRAVAAVRRALEAHELSCYDEASHTGSLRYLLASVERRTEKVQLTLVANAADPADRALGRFARRLWEARGDAPLHSVWANANPTRTNTILSQAAGSWRLLAGEPSVREELSTGARLVLPPFVFRQANLDAFDAIVERVMEAVPRGARVVEWYAGIGLLGLSLAPSCEWVRCSDLNPPRDAFEASRELLPAEARPRISYRVGAAEELVDEARDAEVAVVDPPRKGLEPGLLRALCAPVDGGGPCADLSTLVYVSCGWKALRRDADSLLAAGWTVRGAEAEAHVLFMGADHIETLVVFERET